MLASRGITEESPGSGAIAPYGRPNNLIVNKRSGADWANTSDYLQVANRQLNPLRCAIYTSAHAPASRHTCKAWRDLSKVELFGFVGVVAINKDPVVPRIDAGIDRCSIGWQSAESSGGGCLLS